VVENIKKIERGGTAVAIPKPKPAIKATPPPVAESNSNSGRLILIVAIIAIAIFVWRIVGAPDKAPQAPHIANAEIGRTKPPNDIQRDRPPPPPRDGPPDFPPDGPPDLPPRDGPGERSRPVPQETATKVQGHLARSAKPGVTFVISIPSEVENTFFPKSSGRKSVGFSPPGAFRQFSLLENDSPHAIGMHPDPHSNGRLQLNIGGAYSRFVAAVSQNDFVPPAANPFIFLVYGDNKLIWQSKPIASTADTDFCDVSIKGVESLRLEVKPTGEPRANHAIWFEPFLEK
jgi:hypothetical protein